MKYSVIIPLYNKAPYIRKALESVFAQTYTDYELIVVDDGSTDESASIVEELLASPKSSPKGKDLNTEENFPSLQGEKSPEWTFDSERPFITPMEGNVQTGEQKNRGRLIRQANAGVSAARNNGVAQSHGEYIAFLDADDWWEPTYLERMAQLIEDYPEAGLYACNYVYYKPGKTHVAQDIPTGYINYPKAYYEGGAMPVTSITAIMPRVVFDEMGGFPLGIKLGEDFLLWAKTAMHYPVAFCEEPLAYYNNDVPVNLRATRNLHAPEHHMLFRLELLGDEANGTNDECKVDSVKFKGEEKGKADTPASTLYTLHPTQTEASTPYTLPPTPSEADWKRLIDKLRVRGLLDYWMSKEYHDMAAQELAKVDWSQQPDSMKRIYKTPIWMLKVKRLVMKWGSAVKQALISASFSGRAKALLFRD